MNNQDNNGQVNANFKVNPLPPFWPLPGSSKGGSSRPSGQGNHPQESDPGAPLPGATGAIGGPATDPSALLTETVANTTEFSSDITSKEAKDTFRSVEQSLPSVITDGHEHTIKSFLERPFIYQTASWTTTQAVGTTLGIGFNVPSNIISTNPMIADKIDGFLGFKATAVIRMQVNANRFQAGRCVLTYYPTPQLITRSFVHDGKPENFTQLPHVQLDVNTESEAILKIPYVSPFSHYAIYGKNQLDWAQVNCWVYSPLVDPSGATAVDVTFWVNFENVEIQMPTLNIGTFTPQAGNRKVGSASKRGTITEEEGKTIWSISPSKTLKNISTGLGLFSNLPVVGSAAGTASWVSDILSKTAKAFGYSKPKHLKDITRISNYTFNDSAVTDGHDNSQSLGFFKSNNIEELNNFGGTSVDEMSFPFLYSVKSYITSFTWTTTSMPNAQLWVYPISPNYLNASSLYLTGSAGNIFVGPPFYHLAQAFRFWRGSIDFTLRFVKTEFHSGRIAISFVPFYGGGVPSSVGVNGTTFLHRDVVDLRGLVSYEFSIPYTSLLPYQTIGCPTGYIMIHVVNELRAPSSVSNSITVLVETGAGEDFELAVPVNIMPTHAESFSFAPGLEIGELKTQGGGVDVNEDALESKGVSMEPKRVLGALQTRPDMNIKPAALCVGERVMSISTLLKRFQPLFNLDEISQYNTLSNGFVLQTACYWDAEPNWVQGTGNWASTITVGSNGISSTTNVGTNYFYLAWFRKWYAFMRGSYRLKLSTYLNQAFEVDSGGSWKGVSAPVGAIIRASISSYYDTYINTGTAPPSGFYTDVTNGELINDPVNSSTLELEVPFYSNLPYLPTDNCGYQPSTYQNLSALRLPLISFQSPLLLLGQTGGTDAPVNISGDVLFAAGDDFGLGFFLGCGYSFVVNNQ